MIDGVGERIEVKDGVGKAGEVGNGDGGRYEPGF